MRSDQRRCRAARELSSLITRAAYPAEAVGGVQDGVAGCWMSGWCSGRWVKSRKKLN